MNVQYKTPGVYTKELDAFPPSIVGVDTAVPVFIGYTETAQQSGRSLHMQPIRIDSLVEYQALFGGSYQHSFTLKLLSDTEAPQRDVTLQDKPYKLELSKRFYLYNSLRLFYANGGATCYVVSVKTYAEAAAILKEDLSNGLVAVRDLVGPTILVIPEAVLLESAQCQALQQEMLEQCVARTDRVALLDVCGTDALVPASVTLANDVQGVIDNFRKGVTGVTDTDALKYGMAYFPFLKTSIVDPSNPDEVSYTNLDGDSLKMLESVIASDAGDSSAKLFTKYTGDIAALKTDDPDYAKTKAKISQFLTANLPVVVKNIYAVMAERIGTLPPSPAMAGVYTANDASRGVWNAPANVGLSSVTGPSLKVSDAIQDDLNVPIDGLAVNAIRDFVGRGTLVWGARTLDGNSNDWRYIQVRRCLIYVEQSVKLALNQFVFAPNVAQTWVTVTSMIGSFLRNLWAAGGLMGTTPAEAFTVQCGLGSTMTADDILNGYMNVQITLQMVHPAEFIVLTFKQEMQGGAG